MITTEEANAMAKGMIARLEEEKEIQKHEKVEKMAWEFFLTAQGKYTLADSWKASENFCEFAKKKQEEGDDTSNEKSG